MTQDSKFIQIKGAREHNLKNIDVEIPKNKLVVITGVSGSGKSSLAFNTIYAEGQRRYIESLSAYARQFLDNFDKPDVDYIQGLSPAISIEQKTTSKNPRSTVGTITEIYDYLRLLFARVGVAYSPATGLPIKRQSISQMVDIALNLKENSKVVIAAPVVRGKKGEYKKEIQSLQAQGFQRLIVDGQTYDIEDVPKLSKTVKHNIEVVIDRVIIKEGIEKRLSESFEIASNLANGIILLKVLDEGKEIMLSQNLSCPVSGFMIEEIEPRLFSFNSPHGSCPNCNGLGKVMSFSEHLLIPDHSKAVADCVPLWSGRSALKGYYISIFQAFLNHIKIDPKTPYLKLTKEQKQKILYGLKEKIKGEYVSNSGTTFAFNKVFEGVVPHFERRFKETESESVRSLLEKYQKEDACPECEGKRLNKKALQVKIDNLNIYDVTTFSIGQALDWVGSLEGKLNNMQRQIGEKIIKEIGERLRFLNNVGISYLTLSRQAGTLSGGEAQRIRLASQIGSGLTGVLYVLDEPSIGLHQKDNDRLIDTLKHLKNLDNTVIVVEHDEDTIREADYILDIGPHAGVHGGQVVACGSYEEIIQNPKSLTGLYLSGKKEIETPKERRKGNGKFITLKNASGNNLKNVTANFPLGCFVCVTGVSGSGKSTLVNKTLVPAVSHHLYNSDVDILNFENIHGLDDIDKLINIDQSPIGKTSRSNPATYTGMFDYIRAIFAETPEAKARGYKQGRFSFNVKGGRCDHCNGDGVVKVEMHFLSDVHITCDECKGKRYNRETLDIRFKGKNISDVLNMTIEDAYTFFENIPLIKAKIKALIDVGLGYLKVGQGSTTLSGGEAQRVKLAKELSKKSTGKTLYILDEPTTGLHFEDINKLLKILHTFVEKGNTVIVIEHNLDVIKTADHIIDIGKEGGDQGGEILCTGTPEEVAKNKESYTAKYIAKALNKK